MNIRITTIEFADKLLQDYEIVELNDKLLWQLSGTNQNYTSKELYDLLDNDDYEVLDNDNISIGI